MRSEAMGVSLMGTNRGDEPVPPQLREAVLDRDGHRCQMNGERGPRAGGCALLEVHHIVPDPEVGERHALDNLITLCQSCHSWLHKIPSREDVPVTISDDDAAEMLPHDYEILQILHDEGSLSTSEVAKRISPDHTNVAVRERLWLLMGLDNVVNTREDQLIDRDAKTNEWGLPNDIVHSARGRIPDNVQTLIQRIEDEQVRRALDNDCSRELTAKVLDIHPRTTWAKQRRAQAYDIPLEALKQSDSPHLRSDSGVDSEQRQLRAENHDTIADKSSS